MNKLDLKNELEKLAELIKQRKEYIQNEEATKQSLIIPFFHKLGYDVFNPLEVEPEYVSDFGFKKGEKVDYAIKKDGELIMFVEAKPVYEEVDKHSAQLYRYFNATPSVRFSVLTNGVIYKLFTDLNQDNIMDDEPFYTFNIEELTTNDVEVITQMMKEYFDKETMLSYSQELVYLTNMNATLKDLFKNPTDDFVRFLIKDMNNQRVTKDVIENFRPIIKKAINKTLLEMIGEGLSFSKQPEKTDEVEELIEQVNLQPEEKESIPAIVTTEEELNGFYIIRGLLERNHRDIGNIKYKDNLTYFAIMDRVVTKWFARLALNGEKKLFIIRLPIEKVEMLIQDIEFVESPKASGPDTTKLTINGVKDLRQLEVLICAAFDAVNE